MSGYRTFFIFTQLKNYCYFFILVRMGKFQYNGNFFGILNSLDIQSRQLIGLNEP
jgi:hypothetical protein